MKILGIDPHSHKIGIPVRIIGRKNLEMAVYIAKKINKIMEERKDARKAVLLFSHSYYDEGKSYYDHIVDLLNENGVSKAFLFDHIAEVMSAGFGLLDVYKIFDSIVKNIEAIRKLVGWLQKFVVERSYFCG